MKQKVIFLSRHDRVSRTIQYFIIYYHHLHTRDHGIFERDRVNRKPHPIRIGPCHPFYTFHGWNIFSQLYSIHGVSHGRVVPIVYCLLADKSRATHNLTLNPNSVISDLENGKSSGLRRSWHDLLKWTKKNNKQVNGIASQDAHLFGFPKYKQSPYQYHTWELCRQIDGVTMETNSPNSAFTPSSLLLH